MAFKLCDPVTDLSAVTATGASASVDGSVADYIVFQYVAASVTTGGTLKIQGSVDGANWVDLKSWTVSANGTDTFAVGSGSVGATAGRMNKYRANLTARTDGAYTVSHSLSRER